MADDYVKIEFLSDKTKKISDRFCCWCYLVTVTGPPLPAQKVFIRIPGKFPDTDLPFSPACNSFTSKFEGRGNGDAPPRFGSTRDKHLTDFVVILDPPLQRIGDSVEICFIAACGEDTGFVTGGFFNPNNDWWINSKPTRIVTPKVAAVITPEDLTTGIVASQLALLLDKKFAKEPLTRLAGLPLAAIKGLSQKNARKVEEVFGAKKIGDLMRSDLLESIAILTNLIGRAE